MALLVNASYSQVKCLKLPFLPSLRFRARTYPKDRQGLRSNSVSDGIAGDSELSKMEMGLGTDSYPLCSDANSVSHTKNSQDLDHQLFDALE